MAESVYFNSSMPSIWQVLISQIYSQSFPDGSRVPNNNIENVAASIMGCMYAESGCDSTRIQGDVISGTYSKEYTAKVNDKTISKADFVNGTQYPEYHMTGAGYGLCQWTYSTRKANLYAFTIESRTGIENITKQSMFCTNELFNKTNVTFNSSIKTIITNSASTREQICDVIFRHYELIDPSRPEATVQSQSRMRQGYANEIYNKYSGTVPIGDDTTTTQLKINAVIDNLVNVALGEYNKRVKEEPANSNNVKYNTWFYNGEVNGSDYPWCMAFVQWCLNQVGIPAFRTASCSAFWANTNPSDVGNKISPADLRINRGQLQKGDIALFGKAYNQNDDNDFDHVGIIVENKGLGQYITVEGNTSYDDLGSQSNGGAVAKKTRYTYLRPGSSDSIYIKAAIRMVSADNINTVSNGVLTDAIESQLAAGIIGSNASSYTSGGPLTEADHISYQYKTEKVTVEQVVDEIVTTDINPNQARVKGTSLLTTPTYVESPFIILEVGDYSFGSYTAKGSLQARNSQKIVTYPNYMTSIDVVKVNGTVNQYTIQMVYQIEAGQDPNLIDKILSKVGYGGTVYISYGDWNAPSFRYKREEAIITNVTSNVDFAQSRITYQIKCTSNAIKLLGNYQAFPAQDAKPSKLINEIIINNTYSILDIFPGMKNFVMVSRKGLIPDDDCVVHLEAKPSLDILSYLNYLVSCMTDAGTDKNGLRKSNYYLTICDDITGEFGGTYFKISKLTANANSVALDTSGIYEVDVGYPGDTLVIGFSIEDNNSWSLLYNYSNEVNMEQYTYNVDNNGKIIQTSSPNILRSVNYNYVTEEQRNWWTLMTQFPIKATLTIKGLLRPAMLMTYVRINAFFYGQRHVSSGIYAITRQEDKIDRSGYRTVLSLVRVAGDTDVLQSSTRTMTYELPVNEVIIDGNEYKASGHNFSGAGGKF